MYGNIHTDLAMEARESNSALNGVSEERTDNEHYSVSRIKIDTDEAASALQKSKGLYITIEAPDLVLREPELIKAVTEALSAELTGLIDKGSAKGSASGTVLVVGLGNRAVTPDALGPKTAEKILVTRHIKQYMPDAIPNGVRSVCAVSPGVLGVTGIETMEVIQGIVERSKPSLIIAIDSLSSRRTERIASTIQLCDAGIQPGAGVGNIRSGLDEASLGIPVIAVGVPLVVYASTISRDTIGLIASELGLLGNEEKIKELAAKAISEKTGELIVTPKEIDSLIECTSTILADGINMCLFGKDYAEVRSLIA
ncbi:MAG: GPR endopeptidase [Eubacteriales bacterium]|nr:GPR endopeptidase [Clostridiales bacterium]MDY5693425.1 GPR endopeptidase [Eubacteriales bacterium]